MKVKRENIIRFEKIFCTCIIALYELVCQVYCYILIANSKKLKYFAKKPSII
jgi:hypothetical protein